MEELRALEGFGKGIRRDFLYLKQKPQFRATPLNRKLGLHLLCGCFVRKLQCELVQEVETDESTIHCYQARVESKVSSDSYQVKLFTSWTRKELLDVQCACLKFVSFLLFCFSLSYLNPH